MGLVYIALLRVWIDCMEIHQEKEIDTTAVAIHDADLTIELCRSHRLIPPTIYLDHD